MSCIVSGAVSGKARLLSVLRPAEGGLLWRTAKVDIVDEIKLPQQTHRMTYLTLNAIERHFYIAQHKVGLPLIFSGAACMLSKVHSS